MDYACPRRPSTRTRSRCIVPLLHHLFISPSPIIFSCTLHPHLLPPSLLPSHLGIGASSNARSSQAAQASILLAIWFRWRWVDGIKLHGIMVPYAANFSVVKERVLVGRWREGFGGYGHARSSSRTSRSSGNPGGRFVFGSGPDNACRME